MSENSLAPENTGNYTVVCPHCREYVWIEETRCAIFRHGVFKHNGEQMPPHASKEECERWVAHGEILGCGRPFRVVVAQKATEDAPFEAIVCDYI